MACKNGCSWTPAWVNVNGKKVYGLLCGNGCGTFKKS